MQQTSTLMALSQLAHLMWTCSLAAFAYVRQRSRLDKTKECPIWKFSLRRVTHEHHLCACNADFFRALNGVDYTAEHYPTAINHNIWPQ